MSKQHPNRTSPLRWRAKNDNRADHESAFGPFFNSLLEVTWGEFSAAKSWKCLRFASPQREHHQTMSSCRRLRLAPQMCACGHSPSIKVGARAHAALLRSSAAPVAILARRGLK